MTYRVSLSRLFKEQIKQVKELDTILNVKKITQTNELTAKNLEEMGKSSEITIETTTIRVKVPGTPYTVVYKVKSDPRQVLVVKKIVKHR